MAEVEIFEEQTFGELSAVILYSLCFWTGIGSHNGCVNKCFFFLRKLVQSMSNVGPISAIPNRPPTVGRN